MTLEKSLEIPGGFQTSFWNIRASLIVQLVKNPCAMQETPFGSWVRKICWRRDRLPTPVFLGFPCGYLREYLISKVILYKFILEKLEIIEKYLKETRSHPQAHQPQITVIGIFKYLLPAVLLGIHRVIAYTKYSGFSFFLTLLLSSHSVVSLFATPWTAACQASLSITNSQSLLKLVSIESMMPSNHLILCHPLLLLPSIFPMVFSNESVLHIR